MSLSLRTGLARMYSRDLSLKGRIFALEQVVSQYNAFLRAAKLKFPDNPGIVGLMEFKILHSVENVILSDCVGRFLDALELEAPETDNNIPIMSQKFAILRSEVQLTKDFDAFLDDSGGLGLIFFDIDFFKKLNEKYTEIVVDKQILVPFQNYILDIIRDRGFGYSVGGDEFIILLRNAGHDETLAFAHRLLHKVRNHLFRVNENDEQITLSVGVSSYPIESASLDLLRQNANKAENKAKQNGRNRVVDLKQT